MSMSIFLVLDLEARECFNAQRLRGCIEGLPSISNWRESSQAVLSDTLLFECDYEYGNDITRIVVHKDLRYLTIEGVGEASLQAALEIQKRYGSDIHAVIAESPGKNANLSTVNTVQDLRSKLNL